MPLVFVHGVNTRKNGQYEEAEFFRNGYFRSIALRDIVPDPAKVKIRNPYWGDDGARMAWNSACLPLEQNEQFGGEIDEVFGAIWSEMAPDVIAPPDQLLLTLARKDLARAVDCLWASAMHVPAEPGRSTGLAVGALARKTVAYVSANPRPAWMASITSDERFVEELLTQVDAWIPPINSEGSAETSTPQSEAFGDDVGIWNRMKEAVAKLGEAAKGAFVFAAKPVGDAASAIGQAAAGAVINPLVRNARPGAHKRASLFLGDVFQYLDQRRLAGGGKIIETVSTAFEQADQERTPDVDEKLIIVAHSMGGNIAYDILTRARRDLACDILVTVGSQVGMFAELGLFPSIIIDGDIQPETRAKVVVPNNIERWINVFDLADPLAYSTSRIFDRAEDYAFSSGVSSLTAHSMYFERPHFYERLRARILGKE